MDEIEPRLGRDEVPMSHALTTNDWETLDSMWGFNMPGRYIWIPYTGFRLRKKIAFFASNGDPTPACVNYGGWGAVGVQTIQIKGDAGETVHFLQGSGQC